MRALVPLFLIFLGAAAPVRGGDDFVIRRLRLVENPRPALLPGAEVLEMNFGVLTPGIHRGFGLALRIYSSDGTYLGGEGRSYFLRADTPVAALGREGIRGPAEYTAYFPVPEDREYLMAVLGYPDAPFYRFLPSERPVDDFKVSRREVARQLEGSERVVVQ